MMASSAALRSSLVMGRGYQISDIRYQEDKKEEGLPQRTRRRQDRMKSQENAGRAKARLLHRRTQDGHLNVAATKAFCISRHRIFRFGLRVFGVDAEGAVFVEGVVEGLGLFDKDVAELFFLDQSYGLELNHFEHG